MNVENLNKLIAHLQAIPKGSFNLAMWRFGKMYPTKAEMAGLGEGNECGTVACIAGHADLLLALEQGLEHAGTSSMIQHRATEWLGLTPHEAVLLFVPYGKPEQGGVAEGVRPSLHDALTTLLYLRETGKVHWGEAKAWAEKKAAEAAAEKE